MPGSRTALASIAVMFLIVACSRADDNGRGGEPVQPLPTQRVTFYGADEGDALSALAVGDFNDDGVLDVAIGAPLGDGPSNDREDAGEVYIFYGPFQMKTVRDAGAAEYDAVFYGEAAGDTLGRTLAAADFNGDGVDDLAMAAPAAAREAGRVYVIFGGILAPETDLASTKPDVLLEGGDESDFAGSAMDSGEFDGEPGTELVIGAWLADGPANERQDAGAVYVIKGERLKAGETIDLDEVDPVVFGAEADDRLGEALTVGDLDGDGIDELIVVATFADGPGNERDAAGKTYVIDSPQSLPLDLADEDVRLTVIGTDAGDQLGHSLGVGDTDGDGQGDIWLGAVSADGPGNGADLAGEAILIAGEFAPGTVVDTADGNVAAIIYGPHPVSRLGRSISVADINGDGLADLLIAAPNLQSRAGLVYVFIGKEIYPVDTAGADLVFTGRDPGDVLGHEAFGAPPLGTSDLDGDGFLDLLIAAPGGDGPDNERPDAGEVYLIAGVALDL